MSSSSDPLRALWAALDISEAGADEPPAAWMAPETRVLCDLWEDAAMALGNQWSAAAARRCALARADALAALYADAVIHHLMT
jgi:hypothetical protein